MNEECPVCLEHIDRAGDLYIIDPCGHQAHEYCMETLVKHNARSCPLCRGEMGDFWHITDSAADCVRLEQPAEDPEFDSCHELFVAACIVAAAIGIVIYIQARAAAAVFRMIVFIATGFLYFGVLFVFLAAALAIGAD